MPKHIKVGEYFEVRTCIWNESDNAIVTVNVTVLNERGQFLFRQQNPKIVIPYAKRSFRLQPERRICFTDVLQPILAGIQDIALEIIEEKSPEEVTPSLRSTMINVKSVGIQQFSMKPFIIDFRDGINKTTTHVDVDRITPNGDVDITLKYNLFETFSTYRLFYNIFDVEKAIHGLAELLGFAEWLTTTEPELLDEITDFLPLTLTVQKLLKYNHKEKGSFSYSTENTWATIHSLKYLIRASQFMDVDESVITSSINCLKKSQNENGSFRQVGEIPLSGLELTTAPEIGLTALVLQAIVPRKSQPQYAQMIEKSLEHLILGCRQTDDVYALAISAYTLSLYNKNTESIVMKIQPLMKKVDSDTWWEFDFSENQRKIYSEMEMKSINIEITSYVLLYYLNSTINFNIFPIMKWLFTNQKFAHGFPGIQSSLVLMDTFRLFSLKDFNVEKPIFEVYYLENGAQINSVNILTHQQTNVINRLKLKESIEKVRIHKEMGHGYVVGIIIEEYYNQTEVVHPKYHLDVNFVKSDDGNLTINTCASYYVTHEEMKPSFAVLELEIPSGYTMDAVRWELKISQDDNIILNDGGDKIVISLVGLDNTPICTDFNFKKEFLIIERQPYKAKLYNYYNSCE